jgi:cation transport ATPase
MQKLKRITLWAVLNIAMLLMAFYGLFQGVTWALNVLLFGVWTVAVLTTGTSFVKETKQSMREQGPSVPRWLSIGSDVTLIFMLAASGHFVSAGAWVWQAICESIIYDLKDN